MNPAFLNYKNSRIAWYRYGNGPEPVICFHGYAEQGSGFSFLADNQLEFSFIAIDLPFHGNTQWNEGLNFNTSDLEAIVNALLEKRSGGFAVLGFSLGGRIALSLFQAMPEKIEKLILLAPDGLKVNFWYKLATQTSIGNRIFKFTMDRPGWFFGFLKGMHKIKLVNPSIFKFVNYYIGDKEVRELLYIRWTSLRKLKPQLSSIKNLVRHHKTSVRLVYGMHDRIIRSSVGEKFRKGIEDQCEIRIIESGHQILHEKHKEEILGSLVG